MQRIDRIGLREMLEHARLKEYANLKSIGLTGDQDLLIGQIGTVCAWQAGAISQQEFSHIIGNRHIIDTSQQRLQLAEDRP